MEAVDRTEADFNQSAKIISGDMHIGGGEIITRQFVAETLWNFFGILQLLIFIYTADMQTTFWIIYTVNCEI